MKRSITCLGAAVLCATLACGTWAATQHESFTTPAGRAAPARATIVCTDAYDPNESCGGPLTTLSPGSYPGLKVAGFPGTGDADWYNVHLCGNQTLVATMTLAVSAGDAEIGLLNAACSTLLADQRSAGAVHTITFTNTGPDADFHLVTGHYDGSNCYTYTLDISGADPFEPNDVCASAASVGPGFYPGITVRWFGGGDFDWYRVHVRRSQKLVLDLAYTNALGNIDGDIWADCSFTTMVTSFFNTADGDHVEASNDGPDADWYIRIGNEDNTCNTYSMNIALDPTGNIDGVTPLSGWSRPVIPETAPGGYPPVLPGTLDGNTSDTYLSWCWTQTGPYAMPEWHGHTFIDDYFAAFVILHEPVYPGGYYITPAVGPYNVRGGRHTLSVFNDWFDSAPETNEADNQYSEQFVWSPQLVTNASPLARALPPVVGTGIYANNDGFQYNRNFGFDGVIGIAGRNAFDDYDFYVYSDYAGSTTGYSAFVGGSIAGSNLTDFVMCSWNYGLTTLFPAVQRFSPGGGGSDFTIDQNEDPGRINFAAADYVWADQVMAADRLVDVYDVYAVVGETIYLTLFRKTGPSDMAFEIFPHDAAALFGRGYGIGTSLSLSPSTDELTFAVPATGFYPIVVYRYDGSSSNQSVTYNFAVSRVGPLSAPTDPGPARELSFAGAAPNPLRGGGKFAFSLPAAGHAALALFDASGRLVRTVADGEFSAGVNRVAWDGRRADGGRLGPGVYWARFDAAGKRLTRRFVVLE